MSNEMIAPEGAANALSSFQHMKPAEVFAENGTAPIYEAIKKEVSGLLPDVSTKEGRAEIAALAYKVARSKTFIDKVGEVFNSDLKKKTKAVDAERKIVWDKLEALQADIRKPLTEWEEKEKARTQAHKDAMAEVETLPQFSEPPSVEIIRQRIERGLELSNRDWEEHKEIAADVLFKASYTLGNMLVAAEKAAKDAAELEALRKAQAEREAKDAADALAAAEVKRKQEAEALAAQRADEARKAAEQKAKDDAVALAAKVETDKKEAEEKAKRDAEEAAAAIKRANDALEAAAKKAKEDAEVAEKKRLADIEEAARKERERITFEAAEVAKANALREADLAHRAKINNAALEAIKKYGMDYDTAKEIIEAIARKQIPHVTITY